MRRAPFGVAVLSKEVPLDFELIMIVSLVCEHEWGPSIAVGFPPLVFPFDASKANCGGGFTHLLLVRAGRFWGEMWASGAWVRMEPFLHVSLILVLCGLVFKYVGDFADFLVVGCGELGSLLRGDTWDAKGVPVEAMFVRGGGRCSGKVGS